MAEQKQRQQGKKGGKSKNNSTQSATNASSLIQAETQEQTKKSPPNKQKGGKRKKGTSRAQRLANIKADITSHNTLVHLGQEPYYIHNNKVYADMGFSQVVELSTNILTHSIVPKVKSELKKICGQLQQKENLFYAKMSAEMAPYNFNFDSVRALYKGLAETGKDKDLGNLLQSLLNLKHSIAQFRLQPLSGSSNLPYKKAVEECQAQFVQLFDSYIKANHNDIAETLRKNVFSAITSDTLFTTAEDLVEGNTLSPSRMKGFEAQLGVMFEAIQSDFGDRVVKTLNVDGQTIERSWDVLWAAQERGASRSSKLKKNNGNGYRYVGASDIIFDFDIGMDIGVSLKLREFPKKQKDGTYFSQKFFGASSSAETIENYNQKSIVHIGDDSLAILMYGIANQKVIPRLSGVTKFRDNMRAIFAWQEILKAVLGTKENSKSGWDNNPTLYIGVYEHIVPTRQMLEYIIGLQPYDILNLITSGKTGQWETRYTATKTTINKETGVKTTEDTDYGKHKDPYWTAKKHFVYMSYKTGQPVSYQAIKDNAEVSSELQQMVNKKDGYSVAVKYHIPIQLFLNE